MEDIPAFFTWILDCGAVVPTPIGSVGATNNPVTVSIPICALSDVNDPKLKSNPSTKSRAVVANPTTSPRTLPLNCDAVNIPENSYPACKYEFDTIPDFILLAFKNVTSDPSPFNTPAVTIPVTTIFPDELIPTPFWKFVKSELPPICRVKLGFVVAIPTNPSLYILVYPKPGS